VHKAHTTRASLSYTHFRPGRKLWGRKNKTDDTYSVHTLLLPSLTVMTLRYCITMSFFTSMSTLVRKLLGGRCADLYALTGLLQMGERQKEKKNLAVKSLPRPAYVWFGSAAASQGCATTTNTHPRHWLLPYHPSLPWGFVFCIFLVYDQTVS
jgi:hypothetical protein